MSFMHQCQNIIIRDPSPSKTLISSKSLRTMVRDKVEMLVLQELKNTHHIARVVQRKQLQELLLEFSEVFLELKDIPPTRDIDHWIPIKVGVDPLNARSYRYPHLQKNETKSQVINMEVSESYWTTKGSYFSPVI